MTGIVTIIPGIIGSSQTKTYAGSAFQSGDTIFYQNTVTIRGDVEIIGYFKWNADIKIFGNLAQCCSGKDKPLYNILFRIFGDGIADIPDILRCFFIIHIADDHIFIFIKNQLCGDGSIHPPRVDVVNTPDNLEGFDIVSFFES